MPYYTFELDDKSANLCMIATPFGLYKYKRLLMGISQASDITQSTMEKIFADIADVEKYINNVGCFSDDWELHLNLLDTMLQ